jgi:hypothetical protein
MYGNFQRFAPNLEMEGKSRDMERRPGIYAPICGGAANLETAR